MSRRPARTAPGIDARHGASRQAVLVLLFDAGAHRLDARALDRLLAWARKQPPGPLDLTDAPLEAARRAGLAERLAVLDATLAGWAADGSWVLSRDDEHYPRRLKRRLGNAAPLLLFGRGDRDLPGRGGIAVLRGTAAPETDPRLVDAMAESLLGTLSLDAGGNEIGITLTATPGTATILRLSAPGTPADRAALQRACFGLADAVVAVGLARTDPVWTELVALIDQNRQPVWVLGSDGEADTLLRAGADAIPPDLLADGANALLLPSPSRQGRQKLRDGRAAAGHAQAAPGPVPVSGFAEAQAVFGNDPFPAETRLPQQRRSDSSPPSLRLVGGTGRRVSPAPVPVMVSAPQVDHGETFYALFLQRLDTLLAHGPLGAARIAETMELTRVQADAWLLQAEAEQKVIVDVETRLIRKQNQG